MNAKKLTFFALIILFFAGCVPTIEKMTFNDVTITAKPSVSPTSLQSQLPLHISFGPKVSNTPKQVIGEHVEINYNDFHNSIFDAFRTVMSPNFSGISKEAGLTGQDFELIFHQAEIVVGNNLKYHYALHLNGEMVFEGKSQTVVTARILHTDAFSFQEAQRTAAQEMLGEAIAQMSENVYNTLFFDKDIRALIQP